MEHSLKIHPEHWTRVLEGTKTFEIRVNDRFFQKGDSVCLTYYNPKSEGDFRSETLKFEIGDVYPIDSERVVFSLIKLKDKTP
jgi:hypothetical protein